MSKDHKVKIAFDTRYVQPGFPGIGRYAYSLAESLAPLIQTEWPAAKLDLIYNPTLLDNRYDLKVLAENYPNTVQLLASEARPISAKEQWQLPLIAARQHFDIWHAPYYIRPYILPTRSVLSAHDVTSARLPSSLPSKKARLIFEITTRLAFLSSRRIIAVSQSAKDDIVSLYKVRPEKITVIYHGYSPNFRPASLQEQAKYRAELNLPETYALYMGINKPHKNLMRLLEAFKQFKSQTNSPLALILAGKEDARYKDELHQHAENLGLLQDNSVRFWGEVSEADLPKLYATAQFFVMPSLYEGFGLPVLEAMASGCPVACAQNSSLPEVAGDAAAWFSATNTVEIAAALQRLNQDEGLRTELRTQGLQQAQRFSWEHTAAATLAVYQSLL